MSKARVNWEMPERFRLDLKGGGRRKGHIKEKEKGGPVEVGRTGRELTMGGGGKRKVKKEDVGGGECEGKSGSAAP